MTVWNCFIRKPGSPYYPSEREKFNNIFDTFVCRICGEEFGLQMVGAQDIRERSFEDQAFFKLADHLAEHLCRRGHQLLTKSAIELKIHEKIARKKFIKKAVEVKICPQCGEDLDLITHGITGRAGVGALIFKCSNEKCDFSIEPTDV